MQFVHKADASRAMEHMQGFAIGGSKIRLSWGRSQCKSSHASPFEDGRYAYPNTRDEQIELQLLPLKLLSWVSIWASFRAWPTQVAGRSPLRC